MTLLRKLLVCFAVFALPMQADVTVNFRNNVFRQPDGSFDPEQMVTINVWGQAGVERLSNGYPVFGSIYKAQLYRVVSNGATTREMPIGAAANFYSSPTAQAGTWQGSNRVIPGVSPGEVVHLKVKAWDSSQAASHEEAVRCEVYAGESDVFTYSQPAAISLPSDTYMSNFRGFTLTVPLTPCRNFLPQPSFVFTEENTPAAVPTGETIPWHMFGYVSAALAVNRTNGVNLGHVEFYEPTAQVIYHPNVNVYGQERLSLELCCYDLSLISTITIAPSTRRPYLAVTDNTVPSALVLRGLAPKRYRVERSQNLKVWEPLGEFIANTSEVPVAELSPTASATEFFRAVEISQ